MKKILVLPLLLCLIFCSFLSLDKIWTNLILTAQHTVHTITGLSGALMPLLIRPRFHSRKSWTHAQCFIQSQICRHSWIASIQRKYLLFLKSYAASVPLRLVFRQAYIQFKLAGCVTPVNTYYSIRICRYRGHAHMPHKHEPALYYPFYPRQGWA